MKKSSNVKSVHSSFKRPRLGLLSLAAVLALLPVAVLADDDDSNAYLQTNLVSNLPGMAQLQDTNLVNAWGISFSATSPFWISDNGTGLSTLYAVTNDSSGSPHVVKEGLTVTIPGDGFPTGQIFNDTGAFHNDAFIFAGEDGYITGWRGALGTTAEILVNRTNTAVYKGITLYTNLGEPMLVAANFREGTVDVYDTNLDLAQFKDREAPAHYAPFNVQNLNSLIIVTFARQDAAKHDDVAGKGHGLIDIFDLKTGKFYRFATGSDAGGFNRDINSPWGVAVAPRGFGLHGDRLLIGNFGDGTIMAFDDFGFEDLLEDTHHHAIAIDGLWGLALGNGGSAGVPDALYFTAGPNGESNGLFGSLTPASEKNHKHW